MSLNQTTVLELVRRVRRSDNESVSIMRTARGWNIIVTHQKTWSTRAWHGATLSQALNNAMTIEPEEDL